MAKDKKSFLIYCDVIHMVEKLPNDKAGELFKHLLRYVNDENPETDDLVVNIAFEPIKQQLKRDLQNYKSIVERNKANGSKGGRPKKEVNQIEAKKPNGLNGLNKKPKKADTDTDTDNETDTVIKKTLEERKTDFKKSLAPFIETYGKDILNEFYAYWVEHGPKDRKMKFEKQKSFGISRRLSTWKKNEQKFGNNSSKKPNAVEKLNKALGIN